MIMAFSRCALVCGVATVLFAALFALLFAVLFCDFNDDREIRVVGFSENRFAPVDCENGLLDMVPPLCLTIISDTIWL